MEDLPIEIFGQIGSHLYKQDHCSLSSINRDLYNNLRRYSKTFILTEFQKDLHQKLCRAFSIEESCSYRVSALPHSRSKFPLVLFALTYIKTFEKGQVVILDKEENMEKWKSILGEPLNIFSEQGSGRINKRIILDSNSSYWNTCLINDDDLLIDLMENEDLTFHSKIIFYQPYGINYDYFTLIKLSILPPIPTTQTLILNTNVFHSIDQLMESHDRITIIGGIKRYISSLRKHALKHGKYAVIFGDDPLPSKGKYVVTYGIIHLFKRTINLSGIVMVRYQLRYSRLSGGDPMEAIYRNIFSSSSIEKIYWHIDDGGFRNKRALTNAYSIFIEEIRFLVELRVGKHYSLQIEKKPPFKELAKAFFQKEGYVEWSTRDVLRAIFSDKKDNPTIESLLNGEKRKY